MERNRKYEKGMAMPITLFLGVLALVIISIILMFIIYGKRIGVVSEKYMSVLEAARGGAHYVIKQLELGGDVLCYNSNDDSINCKCYEVKTEYNNTTNKYEVKCPDGKIVDRIDMGKYSSIPAPDGSTYELETILFYKKITPDGQYYIYSFEVIATKSNSNEKSIIDIVFKAPTRSSL